MQKTVEFYFDYASPYAYLGSTQIESVAKEHGASVIYRPILLGALFKEIGTPNAPFLTWPAAKQRYMVMDQERWASHYGVPFHFPSRFPLRTLKPLRLTLALEPRDHARAVAAFMKMCWVDDLDPDDDTVVANAFRAAGFSESYLARASDPTIKEALRASTERAVEIGVPGAPTFVVDGMLFWGQDRLMFVERALDGWRPKIDLASGSPESPST